MKFGKNIAEAEVWRDFDGFQSCELLLVGLQPSTTEKLLVSFIAVRYVFEFFSPSVRCLWTDQEITT